MVQDFGSGAAGGQSSLLCTRLCWMACGFGLLPLKQLSTSSNRTGPFRAGSWVTRRDCRFLVPFKCISGPELVNEMAGRVGPRLQPLSPLWPHIPQKYRCTCTNARVVIPRQLWVVSEYVQPDCHFSGDNAHSGGRPDPEERLLAVLPPRQCRNLLPASPPGETGRRLATSRTPSFC